MNLFRCVISLSLTILFSANLFAEHSINNPDSTNSTSHRSQDLGGAETKTTKTGHVFTKDKSNPKLGEAWKDESGMIWGDIVKGRDGKARPMSQWDAEAYCKNIGASVPSLADFIRLREYMGALHSDEKDYDVLKKNFKILENYEPQVLPNMGWGNYEGGEYSGFLNFWTSTKLDRNPYMAWHFTGSDAKFDDAARMTDKIYVVRCVSTK